MSDLKFTIPGPRTSVQGKGRVQILILDYEASLDSLVRRLHGDGAAVEGVMEVPVGGAKTPASGSRENASGSVSHVRRLPVRKPGGVLFYLDVQEIEWIEAVNQYARLHTGSKGYLIRQPLSHLETQLDPGQFQRIHRSSIVNLDQIREIHLESQTTRWAILQDERRLPISSSRWNQLQEALQGL